MNQKKTLKNTEAKPSESSNIAFAWLLHLRWGAVVAQVLLVLAVYVFFQTALPIALLAVIFSFEILSNIFFGYLSKKKTVIDDRLFAFVMSLDIVFMTLLLHLTGGPMNPFTFLYLVHIALGSLLMQTKWSILLASFTVLNYASLFFLPSYNPADVPICHIPSASTILADDPLRLHLQGMWVAFAITVFFMVFFIGKVQQALAENQQILSALEKERVQGEKLASLATLSAGAAHEFSTPLSTISVAAGEMLYYMKKNDIRNDLFDDALLIKKQVDRCKDILYQMAADAGEHLGEELQVSTLHDLIQYAISPFAENEHNRVLIDNQVPDLLIYIPKRTFGRIIRGIIKNGLDASQKATPVNVVCKKEADLLRIIVSDSGCGMTDEQKAKACEPFYTNKEPGKGLGLGLYLAKSAVERFNGKLDISSRFGAGTTVTITFQFNRIKVPDNLV